MADANTWHALAKRCAVASAPNSEIEEDIRWALKCFTTDVTNCLQSCIDAIEQHLPGWAWKVGTCCVSDDAWICPDWNHPEQGARLVAEFGLPEKGSIWDHGIDVDRRPSGQPALALCEAFCLAMAMVAEKKEAK